MVGEREGAPPAPVDPVTWPPERLARLRRRFLDACEVIKRPPSDPEIDAFLDGEGVSGADRQAIRQTLLDGASRPTAPPDPFDRPTGEFTADGASPPTLQATEVIEPPPSRPDEPPRGMTLSFDALPAGRPPTAGETVAATLDADPRMTDTFAVDSQGHPVGPRGTVGSDATADADGNGEATTDPDRANPSAMKRARGRSPRKPVELPGYAILQEIGRGGMGVVYKARHEKLGRVVALKMVLAGAHASPDQLARFYTEAQAVAHLQDPGIVQIYEVGEHDGLPYFSLEFVSGGSLSERIDGKPRPPREAAETLLALARTMAVAHKNTIIHRDLKPANVLLTPDGKPKVTDFGLAKRLDDDSGQTRSGAIMGTPSYMSPEQAWGLGPQIGPATDQYALGAILYEMLVGRPPFQGSTPLETLELVRKQEPVPPTRLQPKIPIDLETICLKALQKEIPKRFDDAGAMADDLQRFLEGKTIVARPVAAPERLWRWCLRNPKLAALAATVAFLLATVAGVSSAAAVRLNKLNSDLEVSNKAEKDAKEEAQEKERIARDAEDEAKKARDRVERLVNDSFKVNGSAVETIRVLSVLANDRLRDLPGSQAVREELLNTAEDRFVLNTQEIQKVLDDAKEFVRNKEIVSTNMRTLAGIYHKRGRLNEETGRHAVALVDYKKTDAAAEALRKFDPESVEPIKVLAVAKLTLGDYELGRNLDTKAAIRYYEAALDLRREWLKREPENEETKRGMANALGALAGAWLRLGDPAKARDLYGQELKYREQLTPALSGQMEPRRELAGLERKLGDLSLALDDVPAARKHYEGMLRINEENARLDPDHTQAARDLLLAYESLAALALIHENDPGGALAWSEKALAERKRVADAEPDSALAKADLATSHYYVATALLRLGKREEADENYRACLEIRRVLAADPKTRVDVADLMLAQARCGEVAEAAKTADELSKRPPNDARVYVAAACGFALCAGAEADLPKKEGGDDPVKVYTGRAVDALRLAIKSGWKDLATLQTDPDLDAVRGDPGFLALVADARRDAGR